MLKRIKNTLFLLIMALLVPFSGTRAADFTDNTFLVSELNAQNYNNTRLWNFIGRNNWAGIEVSVEARDNSAYLANSGYSLADLLDRVQQIIAEDNSRLLPVFLNYPGDVLLLDSIINTSAISSQIFYLPQGEAWPTLEYLVQSNRRIIFFVEGDYSNESRILHDLKSYALQVSADRITPNSVILGTESKINMELLKVDNFDKLPTGIPPNRLSRNLVPDYINFLLENWNKFGKKPNFIFVGSSVFNFDFIIDQLNSFNAIKGHVRTGGKNLEKVYWKNPDVLVTGGKFSFPFRGGEEVILSPFAPGYTMTPEHIIVTGEMAIPEDYSILATPLSLGQGLMASFSFEETIEDAVNPEREFTGEGFSFSRDIERGNVLRLPVGANVNIGDPKLYGLPNSSFTVSCFVKFTDILENGDNAVLGNYEEGYRRGMHLVLRSGRPYFGLWANDYMSDEKLENNTWYHLTWRYIIETGEQAIFLNGQFIGGSDGHPPYSGTSNLHIGSAFSQGASLRGYIDNLNIWHRPLGNEEINRLALDEEIELEENTGTGEILSPDLLLLIMIFTGLLVLGLISWFVFRKIRSKTESAFSKTPVFPTKNRIDLFGEFRATNKDELDVSSLFTPKVKELFLFTLIHTLKNGIGAQISDINEMLWSGIEPKKVANNRAVTLNKLRKILVQFDKVEIISGNGYLQLKATDPFFCDYIEAFSLCQIPRGMSKQQLEAFYHLVKKGSLLKGTDWPWLDEIRGFTGNQVIDNLLQLASIYKKESKPKEVEKVTQRIIDYDDLNEEAIYLQVWALQKTNNTNLARFNFNSFCSRYEKTMGEAYPMGFTAFTSFYSEKL